MAASMAAPMTAPTPQAPISQPPPFNNQKPAISQPVISQPLISQPPPNFQPSAPQPVLQPVQQPAQQPVFRPTAAQPIAQPFQQPNIPGIPSHQTDTVFGCTGRDGGWNDPPPAKESNSGETPSKSTSRISKLRNPKKTIPAQQQPAFTPATFTPQAVQPGQMMQNAPPMSQNGFPGFTTEQERVLENERQTRQAFEMAAGPPSKDIRSRLSSKASGRSEEFNAAPIQNLSESDLKMKAIFTRLLQSTKAHPNLQPQFRKKLDNVDKGLQIFYQKTFRRIDQFEHRHFYPTSRKFIGAAKLSSGDRSA